MQPRMGAPSYATAPKAPAQQPFRPLAGMDYGAPPQRQESQAPDMSNFFGSAPLPKLGESSYNQQPPSPFGGPAPLPSPGGQSFDQQPPLPSFGGFRADGGPVAPGQAYVVGERGPEVIVPQMPGMVVPNQSAIRQSPMNRSQDRNLWDSKDIAANGTPNYAQNTLTYAHGQTPSQFDALQAGGFGDNSLANRAARPVGRSANDINRIAEQQRRRGNFKPIMQLGMMDKQQQFYNGQNDKNFAQGQQMWQQNQQAQAAQYTQQRADQGADWQRNQSDQQKQIEAAHAWAMQQHGVAVGEQAMEQERQRQQAEADRQAKMQFGLKPLQMPGTRTPFFQDYNGSVHAGGTPAGAPAPITFTPLPGTDIRVPTQDGQRVPGLPNFQETPRDAPPADGMGPQRPGTLTPIPDRAAKPAMIWALDPTGKPVQMPADYHLPEGYKPMQPKNGADGAPTPQVATNAAPSPAQKTSQGISFQRVD